VDVKWRNSTPLIRFTVGVKLITGEEIVSRTLYEDAPERAMNLLKRTAEERGGPLDGYAPTTHTMLMTEDDQIVCIERSKILYMFTRPA